MGGIVRKCVVIRDDLDDIVTTINKSLEDGADWIITTGGLGPTHDDKTLEGISKTLDCKLVVNDIALKRLEERYFELFKNQNSFTGYAKEIDGFLNKKISTLIKNGNPSKRKCSSN